MKRWTGTYPFTHKTGRDSDVCLKMEKKRKKRERETDRQNRALA